MKRGLLAELDNVLKMICGSQFCLGETLNQLQSFHRAGRGPIKDHRTLKMHFNVSQTQESPINTKGIQTNSFKNTANGVMCELDMGRTAIRILTDSPLMLTYHYGRILVVVLLPPYFSLSNIVTQGKTTLASILSSWRQGIPNGGKINGRKHGVKLLKACGGFE